MKKKNFSKIKFRILKYNVLPKAKQFFKLVNLLGPSKDCQVDIEYLGIRKLLWDLFKKLLF